MNQLPPARNGNKAKEEREVKRKRVEREARSGSRPTEEFAQQVSVLRKAERQAEQGGQQREDARRKSNRSVVSVAGFRRRRMREDAPQGRGKNAERVKATTKAPKKDAHTSSWQATETKEGSGHVEVKTAVEYRKFNVNAR